MNQMQQTSNCTHITGHYSFSGQKKNQYIFGLNNNTKLCVHVSPASSVNVHTLPNMTGEWTECFQVLKDVIEDSPVMFYSSLRKGTSDQ